MCDQVSGHELLEDDTRVFNGGAPVPPGWRLTRRTCCSCFSAEFGPIFTGIPEPEGAKRLPAAEEKEALARWQGRFKITPLANPKGGLDGQTLTYTDASIEDNILTLSGGSTNKRQAVGGNAYVTTLVANEPQKTRFSLWRGADGVLYLDNTGAQLESEFVALLSNELRIKNLVAVFGAVSLGNFGVGYGLLLKREAAGSASTTGGPVKPMEMERAPTDGELRGGFTDLKLEAQPQAAGAA